MALDQVTLGLVAAGVRHGYAIQRHVSGALGGRGTVQRSHVYAALRALERRGFVTVHEGPSSRPPRRMLRATPSGTSWLRAWLDREPCDAATIALRTLLVKTAIRALLEDTPSRREIAAERALRRPYATGRREAEARLRSTSSAGPIASLVAERTRRRVEVELWLLGQLDARWPLPPCVPFRRRRPGSASR